MSHTRKIEHIRRPITSADLIRKAHEAARAKAGVRVKVRFPDELARRARECADNARDQLGEWVNKACRQWRSGVFTCVAESQKTELATRDKSECITIRAPAGMTAEEIKRAVSLCCAYCEQRRITYTLEIPPRYILERTID